jgi:hypothetical protein
MMLAPQTLLLGSITAWWSKNHSLCHNKEVIYHQLILLIAE